MLAICCCASVRAAGDAPWRTVLRRAGLRVCRSAAPRCRCRGGGGHREVVVGGHGLQPRRALRLLHSQLQGSSPYSQKKSMPRFGGDGLKMAKRLLQDGTTYAELHGMLALHGGASAPPPISTADAQRVRTKPGPKPKMLESIATAGARIFGGRSSAVEAELRAELASAHARIEALEAQHSEALNILSPAILRKLAVRSA